MSSVGMCNAQKGLSNAFTKELRVAPELSIVLPNDRPWHDICKFIAKDHCWSVLGIDTPFNIGRYNVTISTYRHPLLRTVGTKVSPVLMNPILTHLNNTFAPHSPISVIMIKVRIIAFKSPCSWLWREYLRFNENSFSKVYHLLVGYMPKTMFKRNSIIWTSKMGDIW